MLHLLLALAVWGLWSLAASQIEASEWFWYVFALVAGLGAQLLVNWDRWYLGLGIGGLAMLIMKLSDFLLVATDWIRVTVLRNRSR